MPNTDACVDFFLHATPDTPNQESLDRGRQIVDEWTTRKKNIDARIAEEMLGLYNTTWRTYDEKRKGPLDARGFCSRLSLCSLEIDNEQNVTFRFCADGMFTEHGITATILKDDEIEVRVE